MGRVAEPESRKERTNNEIINIKPDKFWCDEKACTNNRLALKLNQIQVPIPIPFRAEYQKPTTMAAQASTLRKNTLGRGKI